MSVLQLLDDAHDVHLPLIWLVESVNDFRKDLRYGLFNLERHRSGGLSSGPASGTHMPIVAILDTYDVRRREVCLLMLLRLRRFICF